MSDEAFIPSKYILTTANDTRTYPGRNPKNWKILGKLNMCDDWIELVNVIDNSELPAENYASREFTLTNTTTPCRYFRFEVSAVQYGSVFQLAELRFRGTPYSAPPETPCDYDVYMSSSLNLSVNCGSTYHFYDDGEPAETTITTECKQPHSHPQMT